MANRVNPKEVAKAFVAAAREEGFTVVVRGSVVSVAKQFRPGDKDAFVSCDMMASGVLDMLGAKGGSMWGTDGGSIGGMVALTSGRFKLNVSGVPKRVAAAVCADLAAGGA